MTLTLNRKKLNNKLAILAFVLLLLPQLTLARGLELSVTPTLFEMSAVPSQVWNSQVKVINSNPYPLTVYARVMNFAPKGERGEGKFVPVFENFTEGATLAEWIEIDSESITIAPEQSQAIPFTVRVPEGASPGGHFAAIMIGTQPPKNDGLTISTSQIVTSLFFVRVAGDVKEIGQIREFNVKKKILQETTAEFYVRFENKGNVHIQPQGQIEIFNMWGKERGVIPINSQTHFGNVLPESIRQFDFTWRGEQSISDIGRYKAIITLGYGVDNRQFVSSTAYFYVIPVKGIATVLGSMLLAFWFISFAIKTYIRRMLSLSGVEVAGQSSYKNRSFAREGDILIQKRSSQIEAPIKNGWLDLRGSLGQAHAFLGKIKALVKFVIQYKLFFLSLLGFVVIFALLFSFVKEVGKDSKKYEVIIENADQDVTLSSEEIIYEQKHASENFEKAVVDTVEVSTSTEETVPYQLNVINAGDVPGAAADLKSRLEKFGFTVSSISSDFNESRERTVVIYAPGLEDEALVISKEAGQALLSADPVGDNEITIYIGNDFEFKD